MVCGFMVAFPFCFTSTWFMVVVTLTELFVTGANDTTVE